MGRVGMQTKPWSWLKVRPIDGVRRSERRAPGSRSPTREKAGPPQGVAEDRGGDPRVSEQRAGRPESGSAGWMRQWHLRRHDLQSEPPPLTTRCENELAIAKPQPLCLSQDRVRAARLVRLVAGLVRGWHVRSVELHPPCVMQQVFRPSSMVRRDGASGAPRAANSPAPVLGRRHSGQRPEVWRSGMEPR
jgi:hypothetical protein